LFSIDVLATDLRLSVGVVLSVVCIPPSAYGGRIMSIRLLAMRASSFEIGRGGI